MLVLDVAFEYLLLLLNKSVWVALSGFLLSYLLKSNSLKYSCSEQNSLLCSSLSFWLYL